MMGQFSAADPSQYLPTLSPVWPCDLFTGDSRGATCEPRVWHLVAACSTGAHSGASAVEAVPLTTGVPCLFSFVVVLSSSGMSSLRCFVCLFFCCA